ncbi:amidohydrolase [Nocardiopsis sp. CT-R113]|uniref:Amidohydrolase n=1 Tax=Nocardiopsis codii TaxID=3065942 RepID=A0ABU7KCG6_9ACTN|nr:amidohydrolase [Nocardiopsis sp. CT-R113]MEE2039934.1 amidohydrolase [Nocardiopsis sp. CT-R113]
MSGGGPAIGRARAVLSHYGAGAPGTDPDALADLYRDLHAHPEPGFGEERTAAVGTAALSEAGYQVTTGVGGTGVVGVLRSGPGPAVLLRADMDALPVRELTGLPYASRSGGPGDDRPPLMHACGHDMHVSCLIGAASVLADAAAHWSGTVLAVLQPSEENGAGARAMLDDGLYARFGTPDAVFAQHVFPLPAGVLALRPGLVLGATESVEVTLTGRGGHGSQPHRTVDPVVMAAASVMRLQGVVAREVDPEEQAVLTVARLRAGHAENVIPDEAVLTLNARAFDTDVLRRVVAAARRILDGEAAASGAPVPPRYRGLGAFPTTVNDPAATARLGDAFGEVLGADRVVPMDRMIGSEDMGHFGTDAGAPSVFWGLGSLVPGTAPAPESDSAGNHSPYFAPAVEPTLSTGVRAMTLAALTALGPPDHPA